VSNPKVNLTKRVRVGDDLRYCPVVEAANGRVRPHVVSVAGQEEKHEEGAYYIEWREGTKRVRLSVGNDPVEAWSRRKKKEAELNAIANGHVIAGSNGSDRQLLSVAVTEFLEETKLTKKPKTLAAYKTALDYFTESCHKLSLGDVERRDMLKFVAFLRDEKELSARTVYNKFEIIMSFLKSRKIRDLVGKNDWPRFTEEKPEIYEQAQLDALSAVSDTQERLWWDFFLMTGMREQEVQHCAWSDVDLTGAVVKVTHKPDLGWTPKAYKERVIPIPARLVTSLRSAFKAKVNGCALVFPTAGCRPKLDFLDCLKACAERAELDKADFWLHKFRATFATLHLRAGVDLRTVQDWMGHSDIESTMRYLSPSMTPETKAKVNKTFA
jgi:integrase